MFVRLCSVSRCSLLGERLACCDGEGTLASAPVRRLRENSSKTWLIISVIISGRRFQLEPKRGTLTKRFLFEVGALKTIFGGSSGSGKQTGSSLLVAASRSHIVIYNDKYCTCAVGCTWRAGWAACVQRRTTRWIYSSSYCTAVSSDCTDQWVAT